MATKNADNEAVDQVEQPAQVGKPSALEKKTMPKKTMSKKTISKKVGKKNTTESKPSSVDGEKSTAENSSTAKSSTEKPSTAKPSTAKPDDKSVSQVADSQASPKTTHNEANVSPLSALLQWAAGGKALGLVALLMASGALGLAGYLWYNQNITANIDVQQQQNAIDQLSLRMDGVLNGQGDLNTRLSQMRGLITQSENDISNRFRTIRNEMDDQEGSVREQIKSLDLVFASQSEEFKEELQALTGNIFALKKDFGSGSGSGIERLALNEVEQLIAIANMRLQFSIDSDVALAALSIADDKLSSLTIPILGEVRKSLAIDIARLKSAEKVDTIGLLSSLAGLANSIYLLPLAGDSPDTDNAAKPQNNASSEAQNVTESETWAQPVLDAGAGFLANLGDLIQVEKNGQSVKPVMSAQMRQFVYDRAGLGLASAQLAFINADAALYNNRMQNTRKWVNSNFDTEIAVTANWLAEFDAAAELQPDAALLGVPKSLLAIRNAIQIANESAQ